MKKNFRIVKQGDSLEITLDINRTLEKVGSVFCTVIISVIAIDFIRLVFREKHLDFFPVALVAGIVLMYLLSIRYLFIEVFYQEKIIVKRDSIVLRNDYAAAYDDLFFEVKDIKQILFVGYEDFYEFEEDATYSYMDTPAGERLFVNSDMRGNLMLISKEYNHVFGRGIPSREAEEIIAAVGGFLGRSFGPEYVVDYDSDRDG